MIKYNHTASILKAENILELVNFYKEVLGFTTDYLSGDPINYAVVARDNVFVHISNGKTLPYLSSSGYIFIIVEGIKEIYKNALKSKVEVISQLEKRNHGQDVLLDEFTMRDIEGNILRIGELLKKG